MGHAEYDKRNLPLLFHCVPNQTITCISCGFRRGVAVGVFTAVVWAETSLHGHCAVCCVYDERTLLKTSVKAIMSTAESVVLPSEPPRP